MSLITRCPVCGTTFRVQSSQLAAHSGTVRCGKCGGIFNGVAALVEEGDERLALEPSPQLGLFDPGRRPAAAAVGAAAQPMPDFLAEEAPSRRSRWLWGAAALLAALGIAAQFAYRFRAELAAAAPQAREPLRALCRPLGCEVPLPRRPELMSIDSSELQADSRREGLIVLNAVIRNRASFPQDYPALELTLTDEVDRPVLRRVLAPRDYLEPARREELVRQGIAGGTEAALRVFLDTSRTRATGYRLYLFYPS
ncbi:MAG: DUF3426 domain-containing protein [Betaproteobacteria bacterium]|nr:MAG: DUF3426 domain-containing protein [Betaproteobacteria bacterium]